MNIEIDHRILTTEHELEGVQYWCRAIELDAEGKVLSVVIETWPEVSSDSPDEPICTDRARLVRQS